jgi:hypothetical protein
MKKILILFLLLIGLINCKHKISEDKYAINVDMRIAAINYDCSLTNDKFRTPQLCNTILFETIKGPKLYREMMRMKIQMLAMMFIAALALGACSDDDDKDDVKVPEAMSQALKSKYPSAIHVEWEQKGGYFVADCKVDGQEKDVWFNNQAEWQLTETELLWNNLPGTVQTSFSASEYAGWKIEEIVLLEYPVVPILGNTK